MSYRLKSFCFLGYNKNKWTKESFILAIYYPNGKRYINKGTAENKKTKKTDFGNRGMSFEEDINLTNQYYRDKDLALIHKKPTPVQIVNVDYPKRSAAKITEAYFRKPSTTDYNGVYKGHYIDFEAKATRNKQSFPLQNMHPHQVEHMRKVKENGGISFLLLLFTQTQDIFLLDADVLVEFWSNQTTGGRKSIPKSAIESQGHAVPYGYQPRCDYLKLIDKLYLDKNN